MLHRIKNLLLAGCCGGLLGACGGLPPAATDEVAPPAAASRRQAEPPASRAPTVSPGVTMPDRARLAAPSPPVPEPPPPDPESNVFFSTGSHGISQAARMLLVLVAEKVKGKARADVTLIGHTDDAGSTEFNIALAQKRVEAVAAELQALGVASRQIRRVSYGNEASGGFICRTAACRQNERRVELRLSGVE